MKKITTIAVCAAFALGMQAQDVKFLYEGKEVTNEETITCNEWKYDSVNDEYICEPSLSLISSSTQLVDIIAECTSGHYIQMCCGGACMRGVKVTKDGIQLNGGTALPLEFETTYYPEDGTPTVITEMSVNAAGTDNTLTQITFIAKSGENSVSVYTVDNTLVRYENGELVYSAETPCDLVLYSANGQCVLEQKVSGNGSIKAAELGAGVYVYTIGNKSGKIVIR
jgi:hypothetical protein